jgi:hypothetical protein
MPVFRGLRLIKQIIKTVGGLSSLNDELDQKRGQLAICDGLPPPDRYLQYQVHPGADPDPQAADSPLPCPEVPADPGPWIASTPD